MRTLITRTVYGGKDLCFGVPNIKGATISKVNTYETVDDYCTELLLKLTNGSEMKMFIKQEIE